MAAGANITIPGQATADASGTATVVFQAPSGTSMLGFVVTSIALRVTPSPPLPLCRVYRDVVSPGTLLTSKTAGDRGSFSGEDDVLFPGQSLVLQWTGCAVGALCQANLRGRSL